MHFPLLPIDFLILICNKCPTHLDTPYITIISNLHQIKLTKASNIQNIKPIHYLSFFIFLFNSNQYLIYYY